MCETEQLLFVGEQFNVPALFYKLNKYRSQTNRIMPGKIQCVIKRSMVIIDPTKDDRSTQHQEHFFHLLKIHQ